MKYCFMRSMKTGGTFVIHCVEKFGLPVVRAPGRANYDYEASREMFGDGYQYFAIVRNPYTWYRSFWRFRMQMGNWGGDLVIGHPPFANHDFEGFVEAVAANYPGFLHEYYGRYTKPGVIVLRQESLSRELAELFGDDRILSEPRVNRSTYTCTHTAKTIRLIREMEEATFREYDYDDDDFWIS